MFRKIDHFTIIPADSIANNGVDTRQLAFKGRVKSLAYLLTVGEQSRVASPWNASEASSSALEVLDLG